jgi:tetratricopeptide (TPR) repeat protein
VRDWTEGRALALLSRHYEDSGATRELISLKQIQHERLERGGSRRTAELSRGHLALAELHLMQDELHEALDALQTAFRLDLKNREAALLLGLLALDLDDPATANRALRAVVVAPPPPSDGQAPTLEPEKAVAYFHLARLAEAKGHASGARMMATKAVSANPEDVRAGRLLERLRSHAPPNSFAPKSGE